jgi:hypothetical protein
MNENTKLVNYLSFWVIFANIIDAYLSKYWFDNNIAYELNPIVAALYNYAPDLFVVIKIVWTTLLIIFIWKYKNVKAAKIALYISSIVYFLILIQHFRITAFI